MEKPLQIIFLIVGWLFIMCKEFSINILCFFYNNIENIIGGVLASLIFFIACKSLNSFVYYLESRNLKKIFGFNCWQQDYLLVGGKMYADPNELARIQRQSYLFSKPNVPGWIFTQSAVMPYSEIVASDYIKTMLMQKVSSKCRLIFDDDLKDPKSYCSFGGYNNTMSIAILKNARNVFYDVVSQSQTTIISNKKTGKSFSIDPDYDYGVIVKIKENDMQDTQICVVGLGEIGTNGSAYFLANNWKKMSEKFGDKEFGCVIKVLKAQPKSVEMVEYSV